MHFISFLDIEHHWLMMFTQRLEHPCSVEIMAADDPVIKGARASAAMVLS